MDSSPQCLEIFRQPQLYKAAAFLLPEVLRLHSADASKDRRELFFSLFDDASVRSNLLNRRSTYRSPERLWDAMSNVFLTYEGTVDEARATLPRPESGADTCVAHARCVYKHFENRKRQQWECCNDHLM